MDSLENHSLPVEIIRQVVLGAIEGHTAVAATLSRTCQTIYAWIIPVLYSTVVLTTETEYSLFRRTLLASHEPACSCLAKRGPLYTYVRHLWLGSRRWNTTMTAGRVNHSWNDIPIPFSLDMSSATIAIVPLCPALPRVLALSGCPTTTMHAVVPHLPKTLESLSICARSNGNMDLPDMSHFTVLRDITFVQAGLTNDAVRTLLQMTGLRTITRLYNCSETLPQGARSCMDGLAQLRFVSSCASAAFERMQIVCLFNRNWCTEDVLSRLHTFFVKWANGAHEDPRAAMSAKDGGDERGDVDHLMTWYDDWIVGLDPAWRGCVAGHSTQEHSSWDVTQASPSH